MLVITFSLGTQIGGIAGRIDPVSGHPVLPHIYAPFAEWGRCVALAHDHVEALESAASGVIGTLIFCFMLTVPLIAIDFSHGRSLGPLNYVIAIFTMSVDFDTTLRRATRVSLGGNLAA